MCRERCEANSSPLEEQEQVLLTLSHLCSPAFTILRGWDKYKEDCLLHWAAEIQHHGGTFGILQKGRVFPSEQGVKLYLIKHLS